MSLVSRDCDSPEPTSSLTDEELVAFVQAGDASAFGVLFERYNTRLCRYTRRLVGNDQAGDDLAQETFIKALKALQKDRKSINFCSWLYQIASNTVKDYWRREGLVRWLPWKEQEQYIPEHMHIAGPEKRVEEAELVKLALAKVPYKYRICLILRSVEELSTQQIAAIVKISENSVSQYIKRGHKEFYRTYQRLLQEEVPTAEKGVSLHEKPDTP